MIEILNFENFSKNELFGFGKKYEFDSKAIEVFQDLLENIDKIEVQKFADYRREVTLTKKKEEQDSSIESSGEVKEARIMRFPKSQTKITKVGKVESKNKQNTQIDDTDVAVLKNYSKHRKSSKIWGSFKENSYSLVINGKHFIGDVRGEEGKMLVNPKLTEMYWNFLSDVANLQEKYQKRLVSDSQRDSELSKIKTKYQAQLSKFK
jgi:hypothetical protein